MAKKSALSVLIVIIISCVVVSTVFFGAQHYDCNEHVSNEICVVCSSVNAGKNLLAGSGTAFYISLFVFVLLVGAFVLFFSERKTLVNLNVRLNN